MTQLSLSAALERPGPESDEPMLLVPAQCLERLEVGSIFGLHHWLLREGTPFR